MKTKITFLSIAISLFGLNSLMAQWTQTAHVSGPVACLKTIGSDVFVGKSYPGSGLYKLSNDGATNTMISSGLPFSGATSVYSIIEAGGVLFIGTDAGVYKSTDNGSNWSASGLDTSLVTGLTSTPTGIFASTSYGNDGVFRSTDNGASWTAINTGLPSATWFFGIVSSGTTLLVQSLNNIYRSADNGNSWTLAYAVYDAELTVNGNVFYAGTNKSTDDGITWTGLGSIFGGRANAFAFIGANIFVGSEGPGVNLSTDGGVIWTAQNTGLNYNKVRALAISGAYLYSGADGGGVQKRALSEMGISVGVNELANSQKIEVYPNPSNGQFQLLNVKYTSLEVYNMIGERIKVQQQGTQLDISEASKGLYFLKIYNGTNTCTQRLIVQ